MAEIEIIMDVTPREVTFCQLVSVIGGAKSCLSFRRYKQTAPEWGIGFLKRDCWFTNWLEQFIKLTCKKKIAQFYLIERLNISVILQMKEILTKSKAGGFFFIYHSFVNIY